MRVPPEPSLASLLLHGVGPSWRWRACRTGPPPPSLPMIQNAQLVSPSARTRSVLAPAVPAALIGVAAGSLGYIAHHASPLQGHTLAVIAMVGLLAALLGAALAWVGSKRRAPALTEVVIAESSGAVDVCRILRGAWAALPALLPCNLCRVATRGLAGGHDRRSSGRSARRHSLPGRPYTGRSPSGRRDRRS